MNEGGTISLPWLVIRQDDNGNRYRVGRYATRAEAQKIADSSTAVVTSSFIGSSGSARPRVRPRPRTGTRAELTCAGVP